MSFTMICPFCSKELEIPDELEGRTAPCPGCGQEVYLERPPTASPEDDRRAADLRMFAMMQQAQEAADRRTKKIVSILLWIFVWGPLCVIGAVLIVFCLLRVATGHW